MSRLRVRISVAAVLWALPRRKTQEAKFKLNCSIDINYWNPIQTQPTQEWKTQKKPIKFDKEKTINPNQTPTNPNHLYFEPRRKRRRSHPIKPKPEPEEPEIRNPNPTHTRMKKKMMVITRKTEVPNSNPSSHLLDSTNQNERKSKKAIQKSKEVAKHNVLQLIIALYHPKW